jgi:TRAP-type transport system periplasmic protein
MKLVRFFFVCFFVFLSGSAVLFGITIKLSSGAPESSPWGMALNRLAADWSRISNGQVTVQIYHNGIAGDEPDVVRKMRIGQIQAGIFTSNGLGILSDEVMTFSMPFLIRTDEELEYVLRMVEDDLSASIEQNRFHVIAWSKGGWINIFSASPLRTPSDLRNVRLAATADNQELLQAFRLMGYQAIPVTRNELLTSLNSGMVDAFYSSPIAAAGFQWFARAPQMLDLPIAPFLGGLIISERAWRRVPDNLKPRLVESARRHVASLDTTMEDLESEAVDTMGRYGLQVVNLTDEERALWIQEFERSRSVTVDSVFDKGMYTSIQNHLEEFRRRNTD